MDDLALLVVSCDKYSDLWDIFWILIEKYWNDCTLTKYLGTNYFNYAKNNVRTIQVGEDRSWAENVRKMLEQVQENYVVMMLEDFFIDRRIINEKIKILYDHMVIHGYDCLRLEPSPPPIKVDNKNLRIGKLIPGSPYYVDTQPAIWKKSVLLELLVEGYSAWDFEIKNSEQSGNSKYTFYCTKDYILHHRNGVERGKYYKSTVEMLEKNNINVNYEERGIIDDSGIRRKLSLLKYRMEIFKETYKVYLKYQKSKL